MSSVLKSLLGIVGAVLIGILLSFSPIPGSYLKIWVSVGLIILLTGIFSRVRLGRIFEAWKRGFYLRTALIGNFVFLPLLALGISFLVFDKIELTLAFFLYLLTPCTDWFLAFTKLSCGDVERNTALLPLNLVTQLIMLPFVLFFIVGRWVPIPPPTLIKVLAVYLGIPLSGSWLIKHLSLSRVAQICGKEEWLWLAIAGLFGSLGSDILSFSKILPLYLGAIALYLVFVLVVSWKVGQRIFKDISQAKALSCTMIARNSPLVLAIVVGLFPEKPLIPALIAAGPLVELPLLSIFAILVRQL